MTASPMIGVIEDDEDLREIVRDLLTNSGYRVMVGANLREAKEMASGESPPDLLVLDLMLPDGHGGEVIRFLRDRENALGIRHMPVIVLSGIGDDFASRGSDQPDIFLRKPCRMPVLVETIRSLI